MIPPWPLNALFEIVHRFLRNPLRHAAGFDAIGGPLGEHQFHDGFAPAVVEAAALSLLA